jgi:hypothetical protein
LSLSENVSTSIFSSFSADIFLTTLYNHVQKKPFSRLFTDANSRFEALKFLRDVSRSQSSTC